MRHDIARPERPLALKISLVLRPCIALACLIVGASVLAPVAHAGQEQTAPGAAPTTPPTVYSESRVIVEWADDADHADKVDARGEAGVAFESDLGNRSFQLVEVGHGQTASGP